MNKRRLLKLADMLDADAKNKKGIMFDLGVIGFVHNTDKVTAVDCGTTACAMGLAAISGEFERAGLSYKMDGRWVVTTINGRRLPYTRAAMKTFGISEEAAHFLFSPLRYQPEQSIAAEGERYVAKRIRDFVAGKVAP